MTNPAPQPDPQQPVAMTRREAARKLHVFESTLLRMVQAGVIREYRVGKRSIRVEPASIAAYLASSMVRPREAPRPGARAKHNKRDARAYLWLRAEVRAAVVATAGARQVPARWQKLDLAAWRLEPVPGSAQVEAGKAVA